MSTIGFILLVALNGLVLGALGRLLLPGPDPMSIWMTIAVGITGSLVGGLIAYYAFGKDEGPGFILAVICTVGVVYAVRKLRERDQPPAGSALG
jgi:uncharacterized membrane protein YeaQ/YmgE (transglycosylase-associated protein family)